jgi:hypothetical protein
MIASQPGLSVNHLWSSTSAAVVLSSGLKASIPAIEDLAPGRRQLRPLVEQRPAGEVLGHDMMHPSAHMSTTGPYHSLSASCSGEV